MSEQFCTFQVDEFLFGVEVMKVQEVMRYLEMTKVPKAPPVVSGLINLRGEIVTALDLRERLGFPRLGDDHTPMNVVLRAEGESVCLLVDEIGDVVDVEEQNFEAAPETLEGVGRALIRGAYKLKERLLLVLDTDKAIDLSTDLETGSVGIAQRPN